MPYIFIYYIFAETALRKYIPEANANVLICAQGPEEKSLWIVTAQGVQDHESRRHTIPNQGEETTSDKTTRSRARMSKKVWLNN